VSWIPTIAVQTGRGPSSGLVAAAVLNISGIVGSICFGRLSDRFGVFRVVSTAYIWGAAAVLTVGLTTELSQSIYWIAGLAGFFCIGAQLCLVAIASGFYVIELRATGVGSTMGVGRFGAIVGPLLGALLIRSASSQAPLFVVLALTAFLSGVAVLGIGRVRTSRTPA
jgi:AAHS family 4-hydroxybenzoate transporter-like MFS transporter